MIRKILSVCNRFFILLLLFCTFLTLGGCKEWVAEEPKDDQYTKEKTRMECIYYNRAIDKPSTLIYVDNKTGVHYLIVIDSQGIAITVMPDRDGLGALIE